MKCIHCDNEFKSKRKTAKFCSNRCKLAYRRNRVSVSDDIISVSKDSVSRVSVENNVLSTKVTENEALSVTLSPVITDKRLKDYTAQDLYDAIDSYPMDAWICSPEYKELKRRLDVLSVVKLRSAGYFIPNWKGI